MLFKKKYKSISVSELNDLLEKNINLIDVRETYEYKSGHVKKAKNIPMVGLINNANSLLKQDKTYYIMCQSGARSARVCGFLAKQGYHVVNVSGGFGLFGRAHRENVA